MGHAIIYKGSNHSLLRIQKLIKNIIFSYLSQIKFLKTKEGTAMVQMGDGVSVERCVQNLNNVTVGDYTLTLA